MRQPRFSLCLLCLVLWLAGCTWPFGRKVPQPEAPSDAREQLLMGVGCDRRGDHAGAARWYRLAARQGLAEAQNNLGVMLKDGQGVARDEREAAEWFLKAARQGYALAQSNLGWMYQAGLGVEQDYRQARHWYLEAARQGHAAAQNNLGRLYRDGLGGPADTDSALYWFGEADRQGLPQAKRNLEKMDSSAARNSQEWSRNED